MGFLWEQNEVKRENAENLFKKEKENNNDNNKTERKQTKNVEICQWIAELTKKAHAHNPTIYY